MTRARSRSGITAAKIEPMLMSRTMTPNPAPSSAPKSRASTSVLGPPASGTSANGAGKSTDPRQKAGPMPSRLMSRPVTSDPSTLPTAPAPRTAPRVPGGTWRLRVA